MRARRMQEKAGQSSDRKNMDSPMKRPTERRPRRNSDSSIMEKPLTEEEKKAKEARRRERERRHKERSKTGKPSKRLDLIDQLDATSIYGTGCKWSIFVVSISNLC
jgi:hypothetical protein